ncbi:TetR/AcrR family transcriptional regulator [Nonomuraea longicatena]|uniref:Helix-turn-helix domain-containing protein n=1 Tax=Nonomuraea longicatena TaxID=83682 RepID=A0ABN1PKY4_9ACTN
MARPPADPTRIRERAHRVLDASADLVLRWGYDKTTIEDVARAAEVAKGTIYLHWNTRDQLFVALLRRERTRMLTEVVEQDPRTLDELVHAVTAATLRLPLMRAVLLSDSQVLGKLARLKRDRTPGGFDEGFARLMGRLQDLGVLRRDLSPAELVTIVSSVLYGYLLMGETAAEPYRLADPRLAHLVAETVRRTVAPDTAPDAPDTAAVADAVRVYLGEAVETARRKLEDVLEGGTG